MRLDGPGSDNFEDRTGMPGIGGGGGGNLLGCLIPLVASRFGHRRGRRSSCSAIARSRRSAAAAESSAAAAAAPTTTRAGTPASPSLPTDMQRFSPAVLGSTETVWGDIFKRAGLDLPADHPRRLQGRRPDRLRRRPGDDGAVLLPDRPAHLHRPRFLQRAVATASRRRAISPRPMSSRTRSATISRISKARSTRARPRRRGCRSPKAMRSRSGSSSRPIATPACGRPTPRTARAGRRWKPGDLEEGVRAAEAIGDDTLQRQTQGQVVPESFTHGSSAQRMEALRRGLSTGNPATCNYAR